MKVVHKDPGARKNGDWLSLARQLEQEGELDKAASAYEKAISQRPKNEQAYDRLMIIYRKNRDYKKELATIKKAIRVYEEASRGSSRLTANKRLASISKSLLKSLNMVDKKGKALYEAEPMNRWRKRQKTVEAKISRTK